jgi:flagellar protein FlgJ
MDLASLESMKRRARENPHASQKEVAQQFEALFLQMMVKRMRDATPKDGLFDSDQSRMMQSMLDEQMALNLSRPGIGLAQALLAQMQGGANATGAATALPGEGQGMAGQAIDAGSTAGNDTAPAGSAAAVPEFQPLAAPLRVHGSASKDAVRTTAVGKLLDGIRNSAAQASRNVLQQVDRAASGGGDHIEKFVDRLAESARAVAEASGLPLRLILGQAALESGWGKREIRMSDGSTSYNLFGIKATGGWKGKVAEVMTTEYENGVARKVKQPFRAYDSYEHALSDYARLITENSRYQHVVTAANEKDAARKIQAAGYATDPRYADKLIDVMSKLSV